MTASSKTDATREEPRQKSVALVFAGLLVAMITGSLDQTIVSTALPTIAGELGGVDHMLWVTTAYVLTSTIAMPVYGKIGDLRGRKNLFVGALSLFLAGSIVCGSAGSMELLIAGRAVQGLGGGGLIVLSQAIVADVVPARKRALYLNVMGVGWAVPMLIGPLLGGLFTDHLSWRWAFWINIPLAVLSIAVALALLPRPREHASLASFDLLGTLAVSAAVCTLTLATSWAGVEYAWSDPVIIGLLVATAAGACLFVAAEKRASEPIMPLELFGNRNFVVATLAGFAILFAMMAAISYLPAYFQIAHGMSATMAGYMEVPWMTLYFIASLVVGALIAKRGRYKAFMVASFVISSIAGVMLALISADTPPYYTVSTLGLMGIGVGMSFEVLVLIVQNEFPGAIVGTATSATNFFREIGTTLGASVAGAVFTVNLTQAMEARLAPLGGLAQAGIDPNALTPSTANALPDAAHVAVAGAYSDAIVPVFMIIVPLMLAGIALMALLRETPLKESLDH